MNFKLRWEELSAVICGNNLLVDDEKSFRLLFHRPIGFKGIFVDRAYILEAVKKQIESDLTTLKNSQID